MSMSDPITSRAFSVWKPAWFLFFTPSPSLQLISAPAFMMGIKGCSGSNGDFFSPEWGFTFSFPTKGQPVMSLKGFHGFPFQNLKWLEMRRRQRGWNCVPSSEESPVISELDNASGSTNLPRLKITAVEKTCRNPATISRFLGAIFSTHTSKIMYM